MKVLNIWEKRAVRGGSFPSLEIARKVAEALGMAVDAIGDIQLVEDKGGSAYVKFTLLNGTGTEILIPGN